MALLLSKACRANGAIGFKFLSTSGTSVIITRPRQPMSLKRDALFACSLFVCLLLVQDNLAAATQDDKSNLGEALEDWPVAKSNVPAASDYLIDAKPFIASVTRGEDGRELILISLLSSYHGFNFQPTMKPRPKHQSAATSGFCRA